MLPIKLLLLSLLVSSTVFAKPTAGLEPVGSATLKVLFWTIYDSKLYAPDGEFDGVEPGLVLEITYRRAINSKDLVQRTEKEWRNLNLKNANQAVWLARLRTLWPDVNDGDSLILEVGDGLASRFYANNEFLGTLEDPEFTRQFLAIWLSRNSSYPDLRNQLVGELAD